MPVVFGFSEACFIACGFDRNIQEYEIKLEAGRIEPLKDFYVLKLTLSKYLVHVLGEKTPSNYQESY